MAAPAAAPQLCGEADDALHRLHEGIHKLQGCKAFWLDVLSDSAFREVVTQQLKHTVAQHSSFAKHVRKCIKLEQIFVAKEKEKGIGKGKSKFHDVSNVWRKRRQPRGEDADGDARLSKRMRGDDSKRLFTALPTTVQADVASFLPFRDRLRMQTWSYSCQAIVRSRPAAWTHVEIDKELCRQLLMQPSYSAETTQIRHLLSHAKCLAIDLVDAAEQLEQQLDDLSDVEAFEEQVKQRRHQRVCSPQKLFTGFLNLIEFKELQSLVVRNIEWTTLSFVLIGSVRVDSFMPQYRWQEVSEDLSAAPGSCTLRASMQGKPRRVDVQHILQVNASRVLPTGRSPATSLTSKEAFVLAEFTNLLKVEGVEEFLRLHAGGFLYPPRRGKAVHRYGAKRLAQAAMEMAPPP
eukprot:TRINITY_DN14483_c0_g1_i2.p1 TRINITY_DN14483_c0_g1~~TRINITY_DN14483_c0_g1_i2.p1  ORF type:complete len:405 (-),score=65.14 TRINITY_DN14483_c0_g1_i2:75-1289(-)